MPKGPDEERPARRLAFPSHLFERCPTSGSSGHYLYLPQRNGSKNPSCAKKDLYVTSKVSGNTYLFKWSYGGMIITLKKGTSRDLQRTSASSAVSKHHEVDVAISNTAAESWREWLDQAQASPRLAQDFLFQSSRVEFGGAVDLAGLAGA